MEGVPRPLTVTGNAVIPAWSPDGAWVYYTLVDSKGHSDIWKVAATGGASMRVTSLDAYGAFPSPDGVTLYVSNQAKSGIYSVAVRGGEGVKLEGFAGLKVNQTAVSPSGIYFFPRGQEAGRRQLMRFRFATRTVEPVQLIIGRSCLGSPFRGMREKCYMCGMRGLFRR